MKLFLDASALIYWVEAAEPFYSRLVARFDELLRSDPNLPVAVSRLSFIECLVRPRRLKDELIENQYRDLFARPNLLTVDLTANVIETALDLRVQYNLHTADALQAGSAMALGSDIIFLTGDRHFQRVNELLVDLI